MHRTPESIQQSHPGRKDKISKLFLSKHPLCQQCEKLGKLTPATETHHIKPIAEGGSDEDDNLMALCKSCHSRFTIGETLGKWSPLFKPLE